MKNLSIIIPVFNEGETIKKTLLLLDAAIKRRNGMKTEIILVSDGSSDNSCKEAIDSNIGNLKVLHYFQNGGKGKALKQGFQKSSGDLVAFIDADLDIHPLLLRDFIRDFKQGEADILVGSKRHPKSKVKGPFLRKFMSHAYQALLQPLFGLPVKDTQVGLKIFKREVLEEVFDKLAVKRYAFDLELLVVANYLKHSIKEAPVEINFSYGSSKITYKDIIRMIVDTAAVYYRLKIAKQYNNGNGQNKLRSKPRLALEDIPQEEEFVVDVSKLQMAGKNRKKRVLVAGGAGFIGSHLCDRLIEENEVICLDNLSTGSLENIAHLHDNRNFHFVEHDITVPVKLENIDYVLNLACMASPKAYQEHPINTLLTSSIGTKNLLQLSIDNKCRLLFTSTSEIYGDPVEHPQKEEYWGHVNPIGSRSCYDEGKRFAESLIVNYSKQFLVSTGIVRIFNTYGPRMSKDDGRAVPAFIHQALNNRNITVYGDGSQTRSFCYIDDMVDGILKMLNKNKAGPINLGNPKEFEILQLARKIIDLTNSRSKIVFRNLPADDPVKRRPDISLAYKELEWKPQTSVEQGLLRTIDSFAKQKTALVA